MNPASSPSTALDVDELTANLRRLGVGSAAVTAAVSLLPQHTIGVLAYGSRSRGDCIESSDLDLLALVAHRVRSQRHSIVHLSCYTEDQLRSASGTLFGLHLKRDASVVVDTSGSLRDMLDDFDIPNAVTLLRRVRHLSAVLYLGPNNTNENLTGLCWLARYLLRTAIYALALADGRPCFSIRELAARYNDPRLVKILASNPQIFPPSSVGYLDELKYRLASVVGEPEPLDYDSLESLAVREWDDDSILSQLAIMAMAKNGAQLDYAQLPKILL